MAKEERTSVVLGENFNGEVQMADDVVAVIAGLAATEVEGVESLVGNITNELVSKLGMKNLSKGVKVNIKDQSVEVWLNLNLKYGYTVMEVSRKVQEKVKSMIENMTGLEVADVHIHVAAVTIKKDK